MKRILGALVALVALVATPGTVLTAGAMDFHLSIVLANADVYQEAGPGSPAPLPPGLRLTLRRW